jgi:5'-nucleotidase
MSVNNEKIILICNDDGYNAKGIEALTEVAKNYGRVVVCAPTDGMSGMSHAITFNKPLRLFHLKDFENVSYYRTTGTPSDSVKLAFDKVLDRKPDYIFSGINHGSNTAGSVLYSGTMAAAMEGALNMIPSAGFSLLNHDVDADFSAAKFFVDKIIKSIVEEGLMPGACLNVNIPDLPKDKIKGVRYCRMTRGFWEEEFEKRTDPHNRDYFWLTGVYNNAEPNDKDTDEWAVKNNYVSIVPLQTDMTNYKLLKDLRSREI